jgi:hypothetical protein
MPNIAQQDIAYQPAAKGYSFSTNPVKPSKQERNPKEKINSFALLALEILGLIAVFIVFLLILNHFKIISLSNFYSKSVTPTLTPVSSGITNTNQSSAPANFAKLQNQASDTQIKKYQNYAVRFSKPTAQANPNDYVSDAVFSGYDSKTIQVVTVEGILNLSFDQNTLFQKLPKTPAKTNNASSAGTALIMTKYNSPQEFFKNAAFGSVIQVFYSKTDYKTTQVNYIEYIKPIL